MKRGRKKGSSFDRISEHLRENGTGKKYPRKKDLAESLENVLRCQREGIDVHLSP